MDCGGKCSDYGLRWGWMDEWESRLEELYLRFVATSCTLVQAGANCPRLDYESPALTAELRARHQHDRFILNYEVAHRRIEWISRHFTD